MLLGNVEIFTGGHVSNLSYSSFGWSVKSVANFKGADLRGANLENAGLVYALYDCRTRFPQKYEFYKEAMIPVWKDCEGQAPEINTSTVNDLRRQLSTEEIFLGGNLALQKQDLRGANLKGIPIHATTNLSHSIYDETTIWPEGFDPEFNNLIHAKDLGHSQ